MAVAYYYDHMTKPKQAAYRSMLAGLTEFSDSFQLPLLDARELSEVFLQLRLRENLTKLVSFSLQISLSGFAELDHEAGVPV